MVKFLKRKASKISKNSNLQDEDDIPIESIMADIEEKVYEKDSSTTLVEATMDQAHDRHIRFQEHVIESATLVQHMLGERNIDKSTSITEKKGDTAGSVLYSLMKLDSGRDKSRRQNSKRSDGMNKPAAHCPNNESTEKVKRPELQHQSSSWMSRQYVVPSLEKRKKQAPATVNRRPSNDSMLTTASQFDPITLEDRIRITFEIANILQKQEFLQKLCRALMMYGCPAHRLEYSMRQVSKTLSVNSEYIFIPNVMLMTFYDSNTHTTETHFIRQAPGFEMHRLSDIYRLEKLVAYGEVSVDEALEFIDKVYEQPPIYSKWLQPLVYSMASFSGCVLFYGGRWKEGAIAAALGMLFAVNELFSTVVSSLQPIWEITLCVLIGFVARAIQRYEFCFAPIAFSSFIVVLPGYPMAVSIIELGSRQLVSGVVRMVYAVIYSFLLGYGVSLGSSLYMTMDKSATTLLSEECKIASSASTCISSESQWFNFLLVPLFGATFCVYLKAKLPRWPIMLTFASTSYIINYSLSCWAHAPPQILQIVPAFSVGLLGNLVSKLSGKMSFDAVLLGVFYLVPSGLGVKAALGLFGGSENDVGNQGAGFALVMIETSIGITLGLFLATLLVYPKGTQRTPLMSL